MTESMTYARWVLIPTAAVLDDAILAGATKRLVADLITTAEAEGVAIDRGRIIVALHGSLFADLSSSIVAEAPIGYRFTPVGDWLAGRIGPLPLASVDALLEWLSRKIPTDNWPPRRPLPSWRRRGAGSVVSCASRLKRSSR